jgi:hypothetical protein
MDSFWLPDLSEVGGNGGELHVPSSLSPQPLCSRLPVYSYKCAIIQLNPFRRLRLFFEVECRSRLVTITSKMNFDVITRALYNIGSHKIRTYVCYNRVEKVAWISVCVVGRGGRQGGRAIHLSCPQLRTNSATKSCPSIDESCEPSKHKKVTCRRRNAKVCRRIHAAPDFEIY